MCKSNLIYNAGYKNYTSIEKSYTKVALYRKFFHISYQNRQLDMKLIVQHINTNSYLVNLQQCHIFFS